MRIREKMEGELRLNRENIKNWGRTEGSREREGENRKVKGKDSIIIHMDPYPITSSPL